MIGSTGTGQPANDLADSALCCPHTLASSPGTYSSLKQQENERGTLPQRSSFLPSHLPPDVNSFFCVSPILFPKEEFLDKTRMSLLPATKNPINAFSSPGLSNLGIQPSLPTPILLMQVLNHPSNRSAIQKSRLPKGGCLWIRQRLVTGIN